MNDELYLIWSHEHGAWWRCASDGYTTRIENAGRYTREEAISICANARDGFSAKDVPTEIPVREIDALECLPIDQQRKTAHA